MMTKSTLEFLNQLKENNNRDWFAEHKKAFETEQKLAKTFFTSVGDQLGKIDSIERIQIFRIYRDVRFSKNKTPYKTHFGVSFHRKKPNLRGSYYMHLAPQNSFIASGFWNPNPMDLLRIRKDLEMDAQELRDVITDFTFKKVWGELQGDLVKTSPKGFNIDHPNIDLIRHKQFLFIKRFDDKSVLSSDFQKEVIKSFTAIRPFFDLMTNVLTTDLNGVSIL